LKCGTGENRSRAHAVGGPRMAPKPNAGKSNETQGQANSD